MRDETVQLEDLKTLYKLGGNNSYTPGGSGKGGTVPKEREEDRRL